MKNILLITTGGTISMKQESLESAADMGFSTKELLNLIDSANKIANIVPLSFTGVPSPHIDMNIMYELSNLLKDKLSNDEFDGVVVTHGTDTLEETAYFLDLTVDTNKPIIVTGAMKNSSQLGYDGPSNIYNSICTAASEDSKNKGVLVLMNNSIHTAKEVMKFHTMALETFISPNFGSIGYIDSDVPVFEMPFQKNKAIYNIIDINKNVDIVKCYSGSDSKILNYLVDDEKADGIIIEGFGRGNVPPGMVDGIINAIEKNIPVVLTSRSPSGRVAPNYKYIGGGKHLEDLGVILGGYLSSQKARILLQVMLSSNCDIKNIKNRFEKGYL